MSDKAVEWKVSAGTGFTLGEPWTEIWLDDDSLVVDMDADRAQIPLAVVRDLLGIHTPDEQAGPYTSDAEVFPYEPPPGMTSAHVYGGNGDLSFGAKGFTTVRACVDCDVLIRGGPSRCTACVRAMDNKQAEANPWALPPGWRWKVVTERDCDKGDEELGRWMAYGASGWPVFGSDWECERGPLNYHHAIWELVRRRNAEDPPSRTPGVDAAMARLGRASERADEIIRKHEDPPPKPKPECDLRLSEKGSEQLAEALANPAPPTDKLRQVMRPEPEEDRSQPFKAYAVGPDSEDSHYYKWWAVPDYASSNGWFKDSAIAATWRHFDSVVAEGLRILVLRLGADLYVGESGKWIVEPNSGCVLMAGVTQGETATEAVFRWIRTLYAYALMNGNDVLMDNLVSRDKRIAELESQVKLSDLEQRRTRERTFDYGK